MMSAHTDRYCIHHLRHIQSGALCLYKAEGNSTVYVKIQNVKG